MKIKVRVKLFFPQSQPSESSDVVELPEGAKVREACGRFQIPEDETIIIIKNGKITNPDDTLLAEDVLVILPMTPGG